MTQSHLFDTPRRCIISIRNNTSRGKIYLVGVDASGANITEESPTIPVLYPGETWTFYSLHAYSGVSIIPENLGYPEIVVGSEKTMKCVVTPQFSDPDNKTLRAMIREEIRASIEDIAAEVAREINRQIRLQTGLRNP